MSDVKLSPTRLAALRLVAGGDMHTSTGYLMTTVFRSSGIGRVEHKTPAPYRWLARQGLIGVDHKGICLTSEGQVALAAHPITEES